ncbi:MAG: serine hydrolase [Anaerolineae bacterium]
MTLERLITQELERWRVPGAAVGIIENNTVVHAGGYGLRDLNDTASVTPETRFPIASCTKAFTAFSLGLLVEEGRITWDAPVREYLPEFQLYDPYASEHATIRDLLTHRLGLPRHDLLWYGTPFDRAEMVRRLRYLQPNKTLRARSEYQNLMYITAGHVVDVVTGSTWEAFVKARIFDALGMTNATFEPGSSGNRAIPHLLSGEHVVTAYDQQFNRASAAGSINLSLEDALLWLKLHMQPENTSLIHSATLNEMHRPQMVMDVLPEMPWYNLPEFDLMTYGLGWMVMQYRGHTLVTHTGNGYGFSAMIGFIPARKIGVVALTNYFDVFAPVTLALSALDRTLGLSTPDWGAHYFTRRADIRARVAAMSAQLHAMHQPDAPPHHPLTAYCGTFTHPGYGSLTIRLYEGELQTDYYGLVSRLAPLHDDTFLLLNDLRPMPAPVNFLTDEAGTVREVHIPFEPAVAPIVFQRDA